MISLDSVAHDTFAALIGQHLAVAAMDASVQLELAEVKVLGHKRPNAQRDPFSLTFRGQPGLRLPQGIYRFEHGTLGAMEIFITQIGDGARGSLFEAVFT